MPLRFSALVILLLSVTTFAAERDILDIAKEHPLGITVNNVPAKYGDPDLAKAIDSLGDIPHPWTVPKTIELFQQEIVAWQRKLQHQRDIKSDYMWDGWEREQKRCGYLATLLAASRDPRAAVVLGEDFGTPDLPGWFEVMTGLLHYFVYDPRYRQLPAEERRPVVSTNLIPIWNREVKLWWELNKKDLEAAATAPEK